MEYAYFKTPVLLFLYARLEKGSYCALAMSVRTFNTGTNIHVVSSVNKTFDICSDVYVSELAKPTFYRGMDK